MTNITIKKRRNKPSPAKETLMNVGVSLLAVNPGASLIEIAQYADVGRASLHRHFPSRDALLHAITDRALDELNSILKEVLELNTTAFDQLLHLVEALVPVGDRLHFVMSEWSSYEDAELVQKFEWQEQAMLELIRKGKSEGVIAAGLSDRWVHYVVDSMTFTAWYALQDGMVSAEEAVNLAVSALTGGVINKP